MALHTKKDFAKMCGMTTGNLSNYAKPPRNKVVYSGELIDDQIEPNKSFLQKRLEVLAHGKNEIQTPEPLTTKSDNPPGPEFKKPVLPSGKEHKAQKPSQDGGLYELDKQKKTLELDKLEQEIEILKKKNEKLEGEYYPTELVKALITQLGKSFISEYKDLTENFIIEIAKKKDLTNEEMGEFRGFLLESMNKSSAKAVSDAKREMKNTLRVFTSKKEVGERE